MRKRMIPLVALIAVVAAGCNSGGPGDASKPVDPGSAGAAPSGSRTPVAPQ